MAETGPTITIAAVEGNNIINHTEALAGVALSGTVSGLAANSTFNVTVTDNGVVKTYVATVNGAGTTWSATIPATDATALANGTATVAATVTDANGNQATASQTSSPWPRPARPLRSALATPTSQPATARRR